MSLTVLPEGLGRPGIALPICAHVVYKILLAGGVQDLGNVRVGTLVVTASFVCAIAVVRPQSMDCPGVRRAHDRVCVPELRLQKGTSRSVEAAQVRLSGGVLTRQLWTVASGGSSQRVPSVDWTRHESQHVLSSSKPGEGHP